MRNPRSRISTKFVGIEKKGIKNYLEKFASSITNIHIEGKLLFMNAYISFN